MLAGHYQPLRVWVLCLYFNRLSRLNQQIVKELSLCGFDVSVMMKQLGSVLVAKTLEVTHKGEMEADAQAFSWIDRIHVVTGQEGQPAAAKRDGSGDTAG